MVEVEDKQEANNFLTCLHISLHAAYCMVLFGHMSAILVVYGRGEKTSMDGSKRTDMIQCA